MPRKASRNAQGGGTIRQRPDGRWEARYTVGRDPGTGKQIQRSIYGATQKEVRQRLQQITMDIDEGTYTAPSRLTVEEWLNTWLNDYLLDVKPRTIQKYSSTVRNRLVPNLGKIKLRDLSARRIQHLYNAFYRGTDGLRQLSPKSIHDTHGTLHRALQQAVEIGLIKVNPSDVCKLPRVEKTEIQPMNSAQISDFLRRIEGHPFELIYRIDLFTGMRMGEILGLSWDCIDWKSGAVRIYRQLHQIKGGYEFGALKNDKPRTITVAPSVLEAFRQQRARQRQWRLVAGSAWSNPDDLVFTNEIGMHVARGTVFNGYKRIVQDMGAPSLRFHDLRHSYAVASLQAGDDIKTLQHNLGHYTASFTMDVYGHCTEEMQQQSASRMEGFIKAVSGCKG